MRAKGTGKIVWFRFSYSCLIFVTVTRPREPQRSRTTGCVIVVRRASVKSQGFEATERSVCIERPKAVCDHPPCPSHSGVVRGRQEVVVWSRRTDQD